MMKKSAATFATGWIRHLIVLVAAFAGSAQAAVYSGVWDPPYGSPFTNLGWRGTADYFVPDTCVPGGTADVNNASSCGGSAVVTAAQVELYDITAGANPPSIATLIFNPASMVIGDLRFVSGVLEQLTTTGSNFVNPTENLSAFGVGSNVEFSLFFTFDDNPHTVDGPRLAWRDCSYYDDYYLAASTSYNTECASGINDFTAFPATFTITQVPEPGTLALACLALLAVAPRRVRAALLPRR